MWQGEGMGGPVTERMVDKVCSRIEGVTQAYVGYSEDRESWVFISAYGLGSEKSEEMNELRGYPHERFFFFIIDLTTKRSK